MSKKSDHSLTIKKGDLLLMSYKYHEYQESDKFLAFVIDENKTKKPWHKTYTLLYPLGVHTIKKQNLMRYNIEVIQTGESNEN